MKDFIMFCIYRCRHGVIKGEVVSIKGPLKKIVEEPKMELTPKIGQPQLEFLTKSIDQECWEKSSRPMSF